MTKIGFSGTRHGMTQVQLGQVRRVLAEFVNLELHHGDCIGADAQVHEIGRFLGARIIGHPPTNPSFRAYCMFDETKDLRPYKLRNMAIVDSTSLLLAAPEGSETLFPRSGTWQTIRYATRKGKSLIVINER